MKPRNETAALIRAAADATGCRTVSALAQRLGVPLRTVQGWQERCQLVCSPDWARRWAAWVRWWRAVVPGMPKVWRAEGAES